MAKILLTHGVPDEGFAEVLKDHELIAPAYLSAFTMEELKEKIVDCDAVVAGGKLPGDVIQAGKKLRIIANYGAGYDSVDIHTAARLGIPVTNIPDITAESTAELAFSLILDTSRRISEKNLLIHQHSKQQVFGMGRAMGHNLYGRNLFIVGMGHIGSRVAEMARAFGMNVSGIRRSDAVSSEDFREKMLQMLPYADIVSLHVPMCESTAGLFDEQAFSCMKEGSILINTARGGVVDVDALCSALESMHLSAAGLDVFPNEPEIPPQLTAFSNVVLVPHQGTNTREARDQMARACSCQILDVLAGIRPRHIVNGL